MATGPYPTPYIPVPDLDLYRSLSEGMRTALAQAGREDELARRREEMTEGRRQFDLNLALLQEAYGNFAGHTHLAKSCNHRLLGDFVEEEGKNSTMNNTINPTKVVRN